MCRRICEPDVIFVISATRQILSSVDFIKLTKITVIKRPSDIISHAGDLLDSELIHIAIEQTAGILEIGCAGYDLDTRQILLSVGIHLIRLVVHIQSVF